MFIIYCQVDPSEVWLRSEHDNKALFPDDSGHFNLHEAGMYGATLTVEGPTLPLSSTPRLSVSSTAHSSGVGASASYNSNPTLPIFKSVIPKHSGSKEPTVNIKIIRAKMESSRSGKIEFTQEAQMHLDIAESRANVKHIMKEVQQRWGEEYVIVTVDGLELEDCEGTQGK